MGQIPALATNGSVAGLLENDPVQWYLCERGLEVDSLAKCVSQFCRERLAEIPEGVDEQPQRPIQPHELNALLANPKFSEVATLVMGVLRDAKI